MNTNFAFLSMYWPDIAEIGRTAEDYVYSDPNACIYKVGLLGERLVAEIMAFEGLSVEEETTQVDRLKILRQKGLLPPAIDDLFHSIRKGRNDAVHNQLDDAEQAMTLLRMAHSLSLWFMEVYGDGIRRDEAFVPPTDCSQEEDFAERMRQQERLIDELLSQVGEIRTAMSEASRDDRAAMAAEASGQIVLTEEENNRLIKERIRLDISAETVINYALNQNGVPIIRKFLICNQTDRPLEDVELTVTATPEFCHLLSMPINCVPANSNFELKGLHLSLHAEHMASLVERETGVLRFCLRRGETVYAEEMVEMTSLAFDEWHGSSFYPELLASFVTPNDPEVIKIVARAADHLRDWTGDPSLDAYQTQDPNRVMAQAAAVYAAMQEQEIVYATPPASFSRVGQRVRLCDTVIRQKMGTCLDLTLMYAACLESMGLHPVLLLLAGHIFAGVWLEDSSFPETVQDDASLVTKRLADGVNEMVVVECTAFTAGKNVSFDVARSMAEKQLLGKDPLEYIIDVKRARLCGVLPLPRRICTDDGWFVERESACEDVIPPESLGETVRVTDSDEPAAFDKQVQWERKLLDLCLRNQLINLRLTKNILPILTASLDELENGLANDREFTIWGRPTDDHITQGGANFENLHDLGAYKEFIQEEFKENRLHSSYRESEITVTLKELYRNAKVSMEENGANTLYLAIGLLRWFENDRSTKPRYAPLVLLPVELVRKASAKAYVIRARDDEPQINVTILEKLKQDFQLTVSGLETLPQDEHGLDLRRIFTIVRKAIMRQPKWDVLESAYLGTFSFSQFVMWNDIRNRSEDLKRNKIVRSLIDGQLEWEDSDTENKDSSESVLLPLPADASQVYAIETAFQGESFVLHGPPGTGKSQTITALIANALAHGRTVLFVAEKIAALEVVQRRLQQIGIGDFCLELHSNKSKKRDVLKQLRCAFEVTKNHSIPGYENAVEQIARMRSDLDAYVKELHKTLPCGLSLYDLINQYEETKDSFEISPFSYEFLQSLTEEDRKQHLDLLERAVSVAQVVGHPYGHPFASIRRSQNQQRIRESCVENAGHLYDAIQAYETVTVPLRAQLNLSVSDYASVENLARIAHELLRWQSWPRAWAEAAESEVYLAELLLLAQNQLQCQKLSAEKQSLWEAARNASARLKDTASSCRMALENLQGRAVALCEHLGVEVSLDEATVNRLYGIATELERWSLLPAVWSQKAEAGGYFTDVMNMAQNFLNAANIRKKYEGVWSDDFWNLDGTALLASYREAYTKWLPLRAVALNKLYRTLIPYNVSSISRADLNTYLNDLVKYQEEKRAADELYARYAEDIDAYVDGVVVNWDKVRDDALYAKLNLKHVVGDEELAHMIKRFAGQRAFHGLYAQYREAKTNGDQRLAALRDMLTLTEQSDERWLEDTVALCRSVEEKCDVLGLWMVWHSVAYKLCRHIGSVDDRAPFEMADTINETFLPVIMKERLSQGGIVSIQLNLSCDDSTVEIMDDYRLLSAYMNALRVVVTHMDTYAPALSTWAGEEVDWQRVLEQATLALESARVLRELTDSDELRRDYELVTALRVDLETTEKVTADMLKAYDAFASLLETDDREAPDWLRRQKELCQAISLNNAELKDWFAWNAVAREVRDAGLQNVMDAYEAGLPHDRVISAYQRAVACGLIQDTVDNDPVLNEFAGSTFNEKITRFKKMDSEMIELTRKEIFCRLASRVPSASRSPAYNSEISIMQRAIRSGGRGVSIRKLFEQLPNLLPQLCPCMLMSPISAAQYLDPRREPFDIVVFDEASQLPTCKAVGALARGKSAVIVGDPKQMPPTSFFATNIQDEDHLEKEDLASILDDCLALQMPQTHLKWHYRSRHESLIAFSNSYFYENKLYTFPSSSDRKTKVTLRPVQGVFERGKSRQNREEAKAVVEEILRRYRDPELSRMSVGVVTFNVQQQNLIDDLLEDACAQDPNLSAWVYESAEPLFVKNLENVQGDERDVILFSIGYGPDERGQVYMNFGPLNREGGWRRLNVAVSRARCEMTVFSSLMAEDINLSKSHAEGVSALKSFLEYAAGGYLPAAEETVSFEMATPTALLGSICKALEEKGYKTDCRVGRSKYRVDIGILDPADPDRYILGILLDGESYRDAKTTRDRELAQTEVLCGLGWKLLRVWSLDWWDNRDKELDRILRTLHDLQTADTSVLLSTPEQETQEGIFGIVPTSDETTTSESSDEESNGYVVREYCTAQITEEPLEAERIAKGLEDDRLCACIRGILAVEAPIRDNLLTARVLRSCGIAHTGPRLQSKLSGLIRAMEIPFTVEDGQIVYWNDRADMESYREIRVNGEGKNSREMQDVPVCEAVNAVCAVLQDQFCLSTEDLISEAARLMGYSRTGNQGLYLFKTAILAAMKNGQIVTGNGGSWRLAEK